MSKLKLSNTLSKYKLHIEIAFCIVQAVLLYLTLFSAKANMLASISIILLCFIFSLFVISAQKFNYIIAIAFLFTLISDLFLVVLLPTLENELYRSLAMVSFSVTQLSYFAYLIKTAYYNNVKKHIIIRAIISIVALLAPIVVLDDGANFLAVISVFYYANLITNCIYAFINFKGSPLLAIGLLLFIFCDTFVGVQVGNGMFFELAENSILYKIFFANFNFTWLFYGFSQVFTALSAINNNLSKSV